MCKRVCKRDKSKWILICENMDKYVTISTMALCVSWYYFLNKQSSF